MFTGINIFSFLNPRRFSSPVFPPHYRRDDAAGSGEYGASREEGVREHKGLDVVTRPGQSVFAPIGGKVDVFTYNGMYGVMMDAENGYKAKVLYLDRVDVKDGQRVLKGQRIGYAADIRPVYGVGITNHVHFETWKNGVTVNPRVYVLFLSICFCLFSLCGFSQGIMIENRMKIDYGVKIYNSDTLVKSLISVKGCTQKVDTLLPDTKYKVKIYQSGKKVNEVEVNTGPDKCYFKVILGEEPPRAEIIIIDIIDRC